MPSRCHLCCVPSLVHAAIVPLIGGCLLTSLWHRSSCSCLSAQRVLLHICQCGVSGMHVAAERTRILHAYQTGLVWMSRR